MKKSPSKKKRAPKITPLHDAPMAITSTGHVALNLTYLAVKLDDVPALLERLRSENHELFVAVIVPPRLRKDVAKDIDDACADTCGRLGADLLRRRRPK